MSTNIGPSPPVRFVTAHSPLGWWGVAANATGVCWFGWGENEDAVEKELRRQFPTATRTASDPRLQEWFDLLQRYLAGQGPWPKIPVDLPGTTFQRRVWQALRTIPAGETQSYQQIAVAIGYPTAARAVARACATNPVAVVVPCHRVIGNDGQLRGYAGGLDRKRLLLDLEAHSPYRPQRRPMKPRSGTISARTNKGGLPGNQKSSEPTSCPI